MSEDQTALWAPSMQPVDPTSLETGGALVMLHLSKDECDALGGPSSLGYAGGIHEVLKDRVLEQFFRTNPTYNPPDLAATDDDCTFCGHALSLHTDDSRTQSPMQTACAAPECGGGETGRGRCAVFSSKSDRARTDRWVARLIEPVTLTPSRLANRLHARRGYSGEHMSVHSCSCSHEAMYLLGVADEIGVYWPDGKGGNAWEPELTEAPTLGADPV